MARVQLHLHLADYRAHLLERSGSWLLALASCTEGLLGCLADVIARLSGPRLSCRAANRSERGGAPRPGQAHAGWGSFPPDARPSGECHCLGVAELVKDLVAPREYGLTIVELVRACRACMGFDPERPDRLVGKSLFVVWN